MTRKPRADALRNRERILDCAREVFALHGAATTLDEVARSAGVGIGTLYRHFPNRELLVNELYRAQGDQLIEAATQLAKAQPPLAALRSWLLLFVTFLADRHVMAGVLSCATEEGDGFCGAAGEGLLVAFEQLLDAAVQSGTVVDSVQGEALLCAIAGVATYSAPAVWAANARHLVEVLMRGISR